MSDAARVSPSKVEKSFNFIGMMAIHGGAVVALFLPFRKIDVALAVAFYWVRMFVITGGYHRYFSHRAYKTSRAFQFVLALLGTMCTQKGPLWWAATHRKHHRESDTPNDVHSPVQRGFWYSHIGWVLDSQHESFNPADVKDLYKFPELRWLDRYHVVPVLAFIALTAVFGGLRGVAWWYCMSTAFLFHCTFTINSLSHVWGKRNFATTDDSRNNWVLALITMGEGWHNNHHRYMQSANQGFYWWQVDASYYVLRALSAIGLVWELKKPPQRVLDEGMRGNPAPFAKTAGALDALPFVAEPADAE
ncbi:MAG: hypothetical protein NVS3B20_03740 [Polyangiales bacterium]